MRGCSCRGTSGFAHVSCLAEQAKILVADAEERNLGNDKFARWSKCSLCEQDYHGVVRCALGWACWKTYLGRSETNWTRRLAIQVLGSGLTGAQHHEDALSVKEAELSMLRRIGASEDFILVTRGNLANTYAALGRVELAMRLRRDVYAGCLKLHGEEHAEALREANNYASSLIGLNRVEEAKSLLRKTIPVARRVFGEGHRLTLKMRWSYAETLYSNPNATLDDLSEAFTTLEELARTARRVFGGAHPLVVGIERDLHIMRAALSAREGDVESIREAIEAMCMTPTTA